MSEFKPGDRVRYVGKEPSYHNSELLGKLATVQPGDTRERGVVNIKFDDGLHQTVLLKNVEHEHTNTVSLDMDSFLAPWRGIDPFTPPWFTVKPSSKNALTEENRHNEEKSTFNSYTDGPISLSFRSRHLLQSLRLATMDAIRSGDWHQDYDKLSKCRAAIAKRMGKLEEAFRIDCETISSYAKQRTQLWEEIDKLKAVNNASSDKLKAVNKRIAELEAENKQLASYRQGCVEQLKRIAQLEQEAKDREDFIELLQSRIKQLRYDVREAVSNGEHLDP